MSIAEPKYTPGAMRAAREIDRRFAEGVGTSDEEAAAIVSHETGDADLLEALRKAEKALSIAISEMHDTHPLKARVDEAMSDVAAAIAKAKGAQ